MAGFLAPFLAALAANKLSEATAEPRFQFEVPDFRNRRRPGFTPTGMQQSPIWGAVAGAFAQQQGQRAAQPSSDPIMQAFLSAGRTRMVL